MLRRTVLLAIAAAASKTIMAAGAQDPILSDGSPEYLIADVDHWRETVWEYGFSYHMAQRVDLLTDLCADFMAVKRHLRRQLSAGDAAAEPMAAVAAQMTGLMAMVCTDLGYSRESRHLWRFARGYAGISKDRAVQLWISGHEITSGIYQRRPLPVLANLADQALRFSALASPSAGKAELLGGRAQVLSLMGCEADALSALDELRDTYEGLPGSVTSLRDTVFGWPEHRLHHAESFSLTIVGSTIDAYRAQEKALDLYPGNRQIGRCQIELHRARCLIRDGEIREGLLLATSAVENVDVILRKEYVLAVADLASGAVPQKERSLPELRAFNDLLEASRPASLLVGG